jgi:hypothetical protein
MMHLMQVPAWLSSAVEAQKAFVDGAVIKDAATRQILAHLQPTQMLGRQVLEHGLGMATQPLSVLSGLAGNLQLMQLKRMVEQVQMVASIGAAVSVVNLGVSVGGFAMVLRSLQRVETKLDGVAAGVRNLAIEQNADFMGRCSRALSQADEAFTLGSPAERVRYWQEADSRLGYLIEISLHRLADRHGLPLEGPKIVQMTDADRLRLLARREVLDALQWLMTFASARTELLMCLGHPATAGAVALRAAGWMGQLPTSVQALAQAQMAGQILPPSQMPRVVATARATGLLISAGREVALERAELCKQLHAHGVDTQQHMLALRSAPEAQLLAWMPEDRARAVPGRPCSLVPVDFTPTDFPHRLPSQPGSL